MAARANDQRGVIKCLIYKLTERTGYIPKTDARQEINDWLHVKIKKKYSGVQKNKVKDMLHMVHYAAVTCHVEILRFSIIGVNCLFKKFMHSVEKNIMSV